MAQWDSADLLSKFKLYANRPTTDEALSDAQIYTLLTQAQAQQMAKLAVYAPHAQMGDPVALTTADGGVTYTFGTDDDGNPIFPLAAQVYARIDGRELHASTWDSAGDFVIEGNTIRAPGNKVRQYTTGPYARFIRADATISASSAPVLSPPAARELILWDALMLWAAVGGEIDAGPWEARYGKAWKTWVEAFQTQFATQQAPAADRLQSVWWMARD